MTIDHIVMLQWIQTSENPNWNFLSNNYPPGVLWDVHIVSRLLAELRAAKMIYQTDAYTSIEILESDLNAIRQYNEQATHEENLRKMTNEQLFLAIEDLRNKVFDYEKTKNNSKWALVLSGL
jgi:hypothetical protein